MVKRRKIKIVCDGPPLSGRVLDAETGEMIHGVTSVAFHAGLREYTVTLTLVDVHIEFMAEGVVTRTTTEEIVRRHGDELPAQPAA